MELRQHVSFSISKHVRSVSLTTCSIHDKKPRKQRGKSEDCYNILLIIFNLISEILQNEMVQNNNNGLIALFHYFTPPWKGFNQSICAYK
jgi:hypothetical protein